MVVMSVMNFFKSGAAVPMCGAHTCTCLPDKQAKVIDQKNLWGRLFVMSVYSIYICLIHVYRQWGGVCRQLQSVSTCKNVKAGMQIAGRFVMSGYSICLIRVYTFKLFER
jgi:hypothetical protein